MNTVVEFADAEALIVSGYAAALDAPVVGETTDVKPPTFVLIRRTGGLPRTVVSDAALITVECTAPTKAEAHDLAQATIVATQQLRDTSVDGVNVYRVAIVGGLAYLPDPIDRSPRYTFLIEAHIRAASVPG